MNTWIRRALPALAACGLMLSGVSRAQTYADGFESAIAPQFPIVGGNVQLPPAPVSTRLQWLLGELQAGAVTTAAEVNEHFDPTWLASINVQATIDFIASVRNSYPNARITDLIGHTPTRVVAVIDSPGSPPPSGFLQFGTVYAGAGRIVQFGVNNFGGTVLFPADQNLSLAQAADRFATLSSAPGLFVGRIGANGQCTSIESRDPNTPRATGSVFKMYVLGGAAQRVVAGSMLPSENIALVASELAPGGTINSEPLGTLFSAADLATLMMGISDNTATDLLHERVGRSLLDGLVVSYGHATPTLLQPFLNISEQFHVFRSFDLATANSYVNGSETFQYGFLASQIEPLGPNTGGAFFHPDLLSEGTWEASPADVCRAFAALRRLPAGSDAFRMVDRAMGAQAAQPNVRGAWDRVWYKGGSLSSGANGFHVLVHAWLLEDAGREPFVVVAMANSVGGGIDQFNVQSVLGRVLQQVDALP
jgi:hypothetical protein